MSWGRATDGPRGGAKQRTPKSKGDLKHGIDRSTSAGISGLKAHMEALNTVATMWPINTYGYKLRPRHLSGKHLFHSGRWFRRHKHSGGTNPLTRPLWMQHRHYSIWHDDQLLWSPPGCPPDCFIQGMVFSLVGPKDCGCEQRWRTLKLSPSKG